MPVNPFENMPAILGRHAINVDKFLESFNEVKENGRAKLSPSDNLENMDDISRLSLLANPASLLKQSKAQIRFLPVHSCWFVLYLYIYSTFIKKSDLMHACMTKQCHSTWLTMMSLGVYSNNRTISNYSLCWLNYIVSFVRLHQSLISCTYIHILIIVLHLFR